VLKHNRATGRLRPHQRGLSIVELMVGVAIGLLVVAAAAVMMSGQLVENRRLLLAAQLQQDLRAAGDIMTRELRRASHLSENRVAGWPSSLDTIDSYVGTSLTAGRVFANPWQTNLAVATGGQQISYSYTASETGTLAGDFGFRLNTTTGTLQSSLGNGRGYQDLTDPNTMRVTAFSVALSNVGATTVSLPCAKVCSDGTASCWPTYTVRQLQFTINAEAKADATIKREIKGLVRTRNDRVNFATTNLICPA
jgi:type IV pilus assembly protein PilW